MIITLADYIGWFTENHEIHDLDSYTHGVVVAPIGKDYLIRRDMVEK